MERRQGIQGHCHFTHCILWVDLSNFSGLLVRRWQARWLGRKHILLAFGNRGTLIVSTLGRGEKKTANAPKSHAQELTDTRPTPRLPVFISVLEMGGGSYAPRTEVKKKHRRVLSQGTWALGFLQFPLLWGEIVLPTSPLPTPTASGPLYSFSEVCFLWSKWTNSSQKWIIPSAKDNMWPILSHLENDRLRSFS